MHLTRVRLITWTSLVGAAVLLLGLYVSPALRPGAPAPPPLVATARAATTGELPPAPQGSVRAVVERSKPAVVQISSQQLAVDLLGRSSQAGTGVGSGVIYDPAGLVLTNSHVVDGAESLTVSLPDGRSYPGKLVGQDPLMDIAVVKIEPATGEQLPLALFGDSNALGVGDGVVAIGNALALPGGPTVTAGVVSALGRAVQEPDEAGQPGPYLYDLIQTDAAINPGNSGGPLLNLAGEVVGINTLAAGGDGTYAAQGIGFAVSINTARPIADQLAAGGKVVHPFLGIGYGLVTPGVAAQLKLTVKQGVVITQIASGSPAARAGLQRADVITAVDGQPIRDETTLGQALNRHQPGDAIQLDVVRGSKQLGISVTLGQRSVG